MSYNDLGLSLLNTNQISNSTTVKYKQTHGSNCRMDLFLKSLDRLMPKTLSFVDEAKIPELSSHGKAFPSGFGG